MSRASTQPASGTISASSTLHDVEIAVGRPAGGAPGSVGGWDAEGSGAGARAPSDPEKALKLVEGEGRKGQEGNGKEGQDENTWEVESKPWYHHALFIASCISG